MTEFADNFTMIHRNLPILAGLFPAEFSPRRGLIWLREAGLRLAVPRMCRDARRICRQFADDYWEFDGSAGSRFRVSSENRPMIRRNHPLPNRQINVRQLVEIVRLPNRPIIDRLERSYEKHQEKTD